MSTDNKSNVELLSAILVGVSLLLLLCWLNKNKEGAVGANSSGLKFKREGYESKPPGLKFRSGFTPSMDPSLVQTSGYIKSKIIEGMDDGPVQSMHELRTTMTPIQVKPKKLLNNNVALRRSDSSVQIGHLYATDCDLISGNGTYGHEMEDPSLCREKQNHKARGSLSVDILEMSDIGDRDQLYGTDKSEIVMG